LHTPVTNNEGKVFKFNPQFSTRIFNSSAVHKNGAVDNRRATPGVHYSSFCDAEMASVSNKIGWYFRVSATKSKDCLQTKFNGIGNERLAAVLKVIQT